jgi:ATP-dependent exoDNAse (exonuclease V) alpha subunit
MFAERPVRPNRKLSYTATTRARKLVVLVVLPPGFGGRRHTALTYRLDP